MHTIVVPVYISRSGINTVNILFYVIFRILFKNHIPLFMAPGSGIFVKNQLHYVVPGWLNGIFKYALVIVQVYHIIRLG